MSRKEYKHLTREIVGRANWSEILLTAIGVISIVVLVNFLLVLIPSTSRGYLALKNSWHLLQSVEEDVDLLVLGDSSCRQGVLPDVAAEILGLEDGLNLCTTGNALAVNDAWMLESYLERFSAPKAVIVVHVYDIWWREPSHPTVAQIPLEWGYWQRLRPRLDLNVTELVQFFTTRYVPLYANDRSVRRFVAHPFREVRAYREFHETFGPNGFASEVKANPRGVTESKRPRP